MGILCDPRHPLFALFPTGFYADWQWYDLMQDSRSLILDEDAGHFPFRSSKSLIILRAITSSAAFLRRVFLAREGSWFVPLIWRKARTARLCASSHAASLCLSCFAEFQPRHELSAAILDDLFAPAETGSTLAKLGATVIRADSGPPIIQPHRCWMMTRIRSGIPPGSRPPNRCRTKLLSTSASRWRCGA